MKTIISTTGNIFLILFIFTSLCGCQNTDTDQTISSTEEASMQNYDHYYEDFKGEPYIVRTELKEYTVVNPDTSIGVYGRYTELTVEGNAPDTFCQTIAECNQSAEEAVKTHADEIIKTKEASGDEYQFVTYGFIVNVVRADHTAYSILATEFEKDKQDIVYRFHSITCDTETGEEIPLNDLIDEDTCLERIHDSLISKYGVEDLVSVTSENYAWTADALGIRFYFNSEAVSDEKRKMINDYTDRAISVGLPYPSSNTSVPESYIAMIDRETEYTLPHDNVSVILTKKDDSTIIRIQEQNKEPNDLIIEYADDLSDYYIIRAENGLYLFRERIGYQEGFFYDFSRPDGGFGRFAYNPCQYFDSFLREILLAVPYNPYCVHMAEVKRSFGESSYDKASFVPHGHYTFPSDPKTRYKRFILTDNSLQIDSNNVACRLLEDLTATEIDTEGNEIGEITIPAGQSLVFKNLIGEAPRYDDPPKRSQHRTYFYECLLQDGKRIRFKSTTESTIYTDKGYMNRFSEPVTLWEAQFEDKNVHAEDTFTVHIGDKDYPLIPDYSNKDHSGEEIDFGEDIWWIVEGYTGTYTSTDEDLKDMQNSYFTQEALSHPDERAELVINEDGDVEFNCFGNIFKGTLPEKRYYKDNVVIFMESKTERRSFRIILREGTIHSAPTKIEFYSEGLPATNEPSKVPPLSVYMTRIQD